jgi:hypothetical protein
MKLGLQIRTVKFAEMWGDISTGLGRKNYVKSSLTLNLIRHLNNSRTPIMMNKFSTDINVWMSV